MDEIEYKIYKRHLKKKYLFKPIKKRLPKWYEEYKWEIHKKLKYEKSAWCRACKSMGIVPAKKWFIKLG